MSPVCPGYFLVNWGRKKPNDFVGVKVVIYIVSPVSPVNQYYMYFKNFFSSNLHAHIYTSLPCTNKKNISRITFWFPPKFRVHRRQEDLGHLYYSENTVSGYCFSTGDNRGHFFGKELETCQKVAGSSYFCKHLICIGLMLQYTIQNRDGALYATPPCSVRRTQ